VEHRRAAVAGVVDDDVDRAERLERRAHLVAGRHVDAGLAIDAHDLRALGFQPVRDRRADPRRGAGDERGAAVEAAHQ
jgi:hypothetical protein